MSRPNDTRGVDGGKELARELAHNLATSDGSRTLRLLQMAGLTLLEREGDATEPISVADTLDELAASAAPRAISIWRPRAADSVFERPPVSALGDHYAATPTLRAEKPLGCRRVIWLGESAAAGYFYAPHVTPATMLQERLGGAFDVVDLARTNERLDSLVQTAARSLQLDPDVLVVLAGNNWTLLETPDASPFSPSTRARQRLGRSIREHGLRGAVADAQKQLARRVESAFDAMSALADHAQVPILWVIPEVNIRDWDAHQPVHRLPDDGVAQWYQGLDRARHALREAQFRAALDSAETMLMIDQGLGPTGHRLRARALDGLGRHHDAANAWRAAVDTTSTPGQGFLAAPQASTWVQERIRSGAQARGHGLVDLPEIFAAKMEWLAPDRRLFLDYCHFNGTAMRMVAEAVADGVCRQLRLPKVDHPISPIGGPVEATARLGAALHTAHRLPPVDRVGFRATLAQWCREALDASPVHADEAMRAVASARTGGLPAVLDAAQTDQLESSAPLQIQHGWRWPHLDPDCLDALTVAAEGKTPVVDQARLVAHLGIGQEGADLTRPPFLWSPVERFLPDALSAEPAAFLRATKPRTRFALVTDGRCDLEVSVVARRSSDSEEASPFLDLYLDSADGERDEGRHHVGTMPLTETWCQHSFDLPQTWLGFGYQCLIVQWSLPTSCSTPLAKVIARLEMGHEASLHPVFGELFSLWVRKA